jgi:hypothetical protein
MSEQIDFEKALDGLSSEGLRNVAYRHYRVSKRLQGRDALARRLLKHAPVTVTNWGMEKSACASCGAEVRLSGRIQHKRGCTWLWWKKTSCAPEE